MIRLSPGREEGAVGEDSQKGVVVGGEIGNVEEAVVIRLSGSGRGCCR